VLLDAPLEIVAKRISPAIGMLERVDERHCLLQMGGHSLESLAIWILTIGVDFQVKEPPELAVYFGKLHERLGRSLA
jgi:hypothetical protein